MFGPYKTSQALLLLILAVKSTVLEAGETMHMSLSDAMKIASERHVEVLVANERMQQALARLTQAQSVLWPQVTGTASETRQTRNLAANGFALPGLKPLIGPFNSFDARGKLTQTLFDDAAIQRLVSAREGKTLSYAEAQKVRQDTMALVATLYLDAKRSAEKIDANKAILNRDHDRRVLAGDRLSLGTGTPLEQSQFEAAEAESQHLLQVSESDAVERHLDLTAALGLPPDQIILFDEETAFPPKNFDQMAVVSNEHPDLLVARQTVEQNKADRSAELAEFYPKISAVGDYGLSGNDPPRSDRTYTLGIQGSLPILEGGLRLAKINEAESRIRESEARLNDTQLHLETGVLSARESLRTAETQLKATEATLIASEKQFSLARERLRNGTGSPLELTEAQADFAVATDRKREAVATQFLAQVNLAHAVGNLEEWVVGTGKKKKL